MPLPEFEDIFTGDDRIDQVSQNVREGLTRWAEGTGLDARLLEGVELSNSPADVEHGLGRAWKGYRVVRTDTSIGIPVAGDSPDETRFINLTADTDCVVSLEVF